MSVERAEPWKAGYRSYAGWVPNIRNHLSFSLIGAASRARAFTQHLKGEPTRIVLVLQDRVINDYPLPDWLAEWLFPDIRGAWFLNGETASTELPVRVNGDLKSETDRQGMLTGRIHYLPRNADPQSEAERKAKLNEAAGLLTTERHLSTAAEVRALRDQALSTVRSAGPAIQFGFALMRTGECRIWHTREVEGWTADTHDSVAEQAYYFIKDVVHHHEHHDPSSDQITPLTYFDPHTNEPGHEDEVKWRRETLWSLSREVEGLNRSGDLVDQHRSLGIIAYAEEFQSTLMSHVRDADSEIGFRENTVIHDFDFSHLKASIRASIDVASTRLAQRLQKWIAAAAIFVSCLSLVTSLVSAHNGALPRTPDGKLSGQVIVLGSLDWFLPWMAGSPLITASIVSFGLLMIVAFIIKNGLSGLSNGVQRVASQGSRAAAVTLCESTFGQRVVAVFLNLSFAAVAGLICYCLFRLVLGGGYW